MDTGITARDQEASLEWAVEHLDNARDEVKGMELYEAEKAIAAARQALMDLLDDVRKEADLERYQEW